ncbi:MAG: hypothetical protein PSV16_14375 [Flavobacterium sp.]|nr:hypothetical protein [Flavobacterium sp.]
MTKASSISLMVLGVGLLVIGIYIDQNIYLKYSILFTSIVVNVFAVIRSFQEKRNKN